jgi:hypothetical protein
MPDHKCRCLYFQEPITCLLEAILGQADQLMLVAMEDDEKWPAHWFP